ncbi:MAG: tRNA 5-methoxyuridine(34)/uridine 5-oxyacetic acid(34) synthase CmoB [Bacteroidetes bacterium]|nr:tRNA 5-methoxyuridine(34)/uridine 5-oxyacetic acid(34) synthase CmoB [Bacteroidota bacterium]MBT5530360.1 tRNA 5-methoxyuridine(34)/uridine 5-oxyacetic acid(34) synthase CmoB [Cytophagia bacterium]
MIDIKLFTQSVEKTEIHQFSDRIVDSVKSRFSNLNHGDWDQWSSVIKTLPDINHTQIQLDNDVITIGSIGDVDNESRVFLESSLRKLSPWRKGPFKVFNILINTEWRSDYKWNRLKNFILPLKDKVVLDVGCGNGYHCLRSVGDGAKLTIGVDPNILYFAQYRSLQKYLGETPVHILPITLNDLNFEFEVFDTTFSMGVLYHSKSPIEHLLQIKSTLKTGGQAIIETLVIDGSVTDVLMPETRYAKMRNVWFIPSCLQLELWLKRCGYKNINLLNVSKTTIDEQRNTGWMTFESLKDFLSEDYQHTIEGYPAPLRAIFIAEAP